MIFSEKRNILNTKRAISGWNWICTSLPSRSGTDFQLVTFWGHFGLEATPRKNKEDFQFNIQLRARHRSKWTNSSSRVCRGGAASNQTCPSVLDWETSFCPVEESPKEKKHINEHIEPIQTGTSVKVSADDIPVTGLWRSWRAHKVALQCPCVLLPEQWTEHYSHPEKEKQLNNLLLESGGIYRYQYILQDMINHQPTTFYIFLVKM